MLYADLAFGSICGSHACSKVVETLAASKKRDAEVLGRIGEEFDGEFLHRFVRFAGCDTVPSTWATWRRDDGGRISGMPHAAVGG